jgi:hypothetical protein
MPALVLLVDLSWLQVPGPASMTVGKPLTSELSRRTDEYFGEYLKARASLIQLVKWFNPVDLFLCTPGTWGCRFLTVTPSRHRATNIGCDDVRRAARWRRCR